MLRRTVIPRRQYGDALPMFFTGAVFPESLAERLAELQEKYRLMSRLWIPHAVLRSGQFGSDVKESPEAVVFPVSAPHLSNHEAMLYRKICGPYDVLVNASHTTHPDVFNGMFVALQHGVQNGSSNVLPIPPLTPSGGVFNQKIAQALAAATKERGYLSPYWIPSSWVQRTQPSFVLRSPSNGAAVAVAEHVNVAELANPGFFHRCHCNGYEPHTIYGGQFPRDVESVMVQRALRCGYASRLWLTVDEAASFGATLIPQRREDAPATITSRLAWAEQEYFCASQFCLNGTSSSLPSRHAIHLLSVGAASASTTSTAPLLTCGYPHLAALTSPADIRHVSQQYTGNVFKPILGNRYETTRLQFSAVEEIREHAMLCGFKSPAFLRDADIRRWPFLTVKPTARGRCIHGRLQARKETVYFNVEDVEPKGVAEEVVLRYPVHFIALTKFYGDPLMKMLTYQASKTQEMLDAGKDPAQLTRFWIPVDFLTSIGVPPPDLSTTFHVVHSTERVLHGHRGGAPWSRDANADSMSRTFVHLDDIEDSSGRLRSLLNYFPVGYTGLRFSGRVRAQALERAALNPMLLASPVWVSTKFIDLTRTKARGGPAMVPMNSVISVDPLDSNSATSDTFDEEGVDNENHDSSRGRQVQEISADEAQLIKRELGIDTTEERTGETLVDSVKTRYDLVPVASLPHDVKELVTRAISIVRSSSHLKSRVLQDPTNRFNCNRQKKFVARSGEDAAARSSTSSVSFNIQGASMDAHVL